MTSVQTIYDVLAASAAITNLVGSRIEANERKDANAYPAIVLQVAAVPLNTLDGWSGTDNVTATVHYWDSTYKGAHALAELGRTALQNAGYILDSDDDNFDEQAGLIGKTCVTQTLTYWS